MKTRKFFNIASLIIVLLMTACSGNKKEARLKVVVIGLDGIGWNTLDPLIKKGSLPFFKKIKERGAWTQLQTLKPTISPLIWTSIATGQGFGKHGVSKFTATEKDGSMSVVDSQTKKAPSVWSILNLHKKRSAVINWWVTYPPEMLDGVMVADQFNKIMILGDARDRDRLWDTVYPRKYFSVLREFSKGNFMKLQNDRGIPNYPQIYNRLNPGEDFRKLPILQLYQSFVRQELLTERVTDYLYRKEDCDFFAVYFRLTDVTQHMVLSMLPPDYKDVIEEKLQKQSLAAAEKTVLQNRICDILEPIFQYAEKIVERLMTHPKYQDAYFFILSDHGFAFVPGGYDHTVNIVNQPPPPGILLAVGPEIKPGYFPHASVVDFTPTILYLFNLPVGKKMDGKPLQEIFQFRRPTRYQEYPLSIVHFTSKKKDKDIDQKNLDELRSLGYIK